MTYILAAGIEDENYLPDTPGFFSWVAPVHQNRLALIRALVLPGLGSPASFRDLGSLKEVIAWLELNYPLNAANLEFHPATHTAATAQELRPVTLSQAQGWAHNLQQYADWEAERIFREYMEEQELRVTPRDPFTAGDLIFIGQALEVARCVLRARNTGAGNIYSTTVSGALSAIAIQLHKECPLAGYNSLLVTLIAAAKEQGRSMSPWEASLLSLAGRTTSPFDA